mgnify:FL=1
MLLLISVLSSLTTETGDENDDADADADADDGDADAGALKLIC